VKHALSFQTRGVIQHSTIRINLESLGGLNDLWIVEFKAVAPVKATQKRANVKTVHSKNRTRNTGAPVCSSKN
jgi:hypothetical protein